MQQEQSEKRTTGDGSPNSGSESVASQGSETLDDLLKEYESNVNRDNGAAEKSNADVVGALKKLDPLVAFVEGEQKKQQIETLNTDIAAAISKIKDGAEELKDVPDEIIRGCMEAYNTVDPNFSTAFAKRQDNPQGWDEALNKGGDWLVEKIKEMPGNKVRSDIEAAHAAVAGTTDATDAQSDDLPSSHAMMNMSDLGWKAFLDEKIAESEG